MAKRPSAITICAASRAASRGRSATRSPRGSTRSGSSATASISDPANHTTINNRNRFFTRGQLLFQPNDKFSVRLIGDYTWRKERCCAAVYVDNSVNSGIGNLNEVANPLLQPGAVPGRTNDAGNNIVNVLRDLGQNLNALHSGYSRTVSVTPGPRLYRARPRTTACRARSTTILARRP